MELKFDSGCESLNNIGSQSLFSLTDTHYVSGALNGINNQNVLDNTHLFLKYEKLIQRLAQT